MSDVVEEVVQMRTALSGEDARLKQVDGLRVLNIQVALVELEWLVAPDC